MASFLPSFHVSIKPPLRNYTRQAVHIRAQSFSNEGKSSNIVDANLSVLRDKVEMLKTKERLERCCKCESGWNYVRVYDYKLKRDREISQFFEFVGIICGTLGFTCLSGIVCLCLVSFFVHLFQ
ncbi:hypothetical protein I3843_04G042700 [Carya illinoinensis]|uniref:Uncharacterized protein n=1 Tax=Carya illinoinensis TaxID=32201 RepID=A0A922F5G0_CARIL|nr:hypothetical protein I3760_04G043700 [Carya illinoinensis]KAG6716353.1 hypothetical protein I3842_04G045000 [Carya illinoinensis]KAG7982272.1 hypothetical protein I3843_04G042700 [Carya illinoinensis]